MFEKVTQNWNFRKVHLKRQYLIKIILKYMAAVGISAEFYKSNSYMAAEMLQPILEETWLSEALNEEWTDGIIVKIPKKGNLKICNNWRGICVLPAISKINSMVILDRIKDHLYFTIDREQAGFRPGSSCVQSSSKVLNTVPNCIWFL